jgi:hypothetical protein
MIKNWYLTLVLFFLCSNALLAQAPAWGGGADQSDLAFGFSFTSITSSYHIVKQPNWRSPYYDPGVGHNITDSLTGISSKPTSGFAIGFIARYRITDHIEVRGTPSLIFADRSLYYTYDTPSENVVKSIQTTTVDFPLEVKLKSDRIQDFRMYVMGGIKYSEAIGRGNAQPTLDPLQMTVKNATGFGSYEAGIGCDIYFEFFKLSPEIKISNSLGNILVQQPQPYSAPLSKLGLHTIMFSLIFE